MQIKTNMSKQLTAKQLNFSADYTSMKSSIELCLSLH